ncbi:hypothetical protein PoB_005145900 [Plakobranchus ocellatus]|uniref:Uncharacterized protein n=1 Tax=Plakobranchus ocellatus TaxID=259542 RepID=A0AAV4C1E5_9GAST|nr:hypothetical protein PoB_005145900 [Plakobranchus ocellatus]
MVSLIILKVRDQLSVQTVICWWREQLTMTQKTGLQASTSQAERRVKRNRVDLRTGEEGDNVAVPVPPVDHGRSDPRNIRGVIIDRLEDRDQCRIAVKAGISMVCIPEVNSICALNAFLPDDVNTEKKIFTALKNDLSMSFK